MKYRFNKKWLTCLCVMMVMMLTACSLNDIIPSKKGTEITSGQGSTGTAGTSSAGYEELQVEESVAVQDTEYIDEQYDFEKVTGVSQAQLEQIKSEQEGKYAYSVMDEKLHTLYAELVVIIDKEAEGVRVSTTDSDELQYVFQCVFNDHPEFYWIEGYSYIKHEMGGETIYLTFSGKYTYTKEERSVYDVDISMYVGRCSAGIGQSSSDYEKVKHVYEYIVEHTEYEIGAPDNQNILSVFIYGKSVCQGYAKAMQYMLEKLGVDCTLVVGYAMTGEGHAWNLVNIDGAYYYCDATWGDASYVFEGSSVGTSYPDTINYDFLNVTTDELLKTHMIENVVPMPYCSQTEANYYVMEGLLFTSVDTNQLANVFSSAYSQSQSSITIKCSDDAVYDAMYDELIENMSVFDYLGDTEEVSYTVSEEYNTFIFWL